MSNETQFEFARRTVDGWRIGQTSSHYESGGHGPEAISTGKGDRGGVSYGTYQLSSKMGTVQEFLEQSAYKEAFAGLRPGTDEFNAKWRALAKRDSSFAGAQHDFIHDEHYGPQNEKLKTHGIDLANRGHAVQDTLWSTSVQFRNGTANIFSKGLEEKFGKHYKLSSLADHEIIEAVQDYKIKHNEALFQSSAPRVREGTLSRAHDEKTSLLRLAAAEYTVAHKGELPSWAPIAGAIAHRSGSTLSQGYHGHLVNALQAKLGQLGYTIPDGRPLQIDGNFGPGTHDAVKAFQHHHNLKVDGRAGPDTLEAIDFEIKVLENQRTIAPAASPPLQIGDAAHPGYLMFSQARTHFQRINTQYGIPYTQQTDNAAACVAAACRQGGMTRIDHLEVAGASGDKIIAAQGTLGTAHSKVIDVPTVQALNTPLSQSSQVFDAAEQAHRATAEQARQVSQSASQQAGPAMSR